jgi:predicted small lipoprotein YifL
VRRRIDRLRLVALAAVMVAAGLALAACGRKGPLDAPPSAALTPPAAARPSLGEESDNPAAQSGTSVPARTQASAPAAPPPRKTSFFLDFLLGR